MNTQDFVEQYALLADEELLSLWAERNSLVPEAVGVLEVELQRRGLNKNKAERVKRRLDELAEREKKGSLNQQVASAKYERNMRHFDGEKEPEFRSPYGSRDIRSTFAYFRHKYRVWKTFHDRTGRWPVLSIWYHFVSWIALFVMFAVIVTKSNWSIWAIILSALALFGARELGARLMRRLDWNRCGKQREL